MLNPTIEFGVTRKVCPQDAWFSNLSRILKIKDKLSNRRRCKAINRFYNVDRFLGKLFFFFLSSGSMLILPKTGDTQREAESVE